MSRPSDRNEGQAQKGQETATSHGTLDWVEQQGGRHRPDATAQYVEYIRWFRRGQIGRVRAMDGRARIAWNLRRIRTEQGVTQESLSVDARVDRTSISGIERGEFNPTVDLLDRLATALSVDVVEFLTEPPIDETPPKPMRAGRKAK